MNYIIKTTVNDQERFKNLHEIRGKYFSALKAITTFHPYMRIGWEWYTEKSRMYLGIKELMDINNHILTLDEMWDLFYQTRFNEMENDEDISMYLTIIG